VGDRLAPLKLQLANVQHAKALSQEWEILRKQPDSEDVRARTKSLIQLGEDLRILRDEVQAWLGADKEKGK
jgi:hypothetical protein